MLTISSDTHAAALNALARAEATTHLLHTVTNADDAALSNQTLASIADSLRRELGVISSALAECLESQLRKTA